MLGFTPKLPICEEERQWVNEGFVRLEKKLGRRKMLDSIVLQPTPEYFPDPYHKDQPSAELLFQRLCKHMHVDRQEIELEIFADETEELRSILPYWRGSSPGCAGFYYHDATPDNEGNDERRMVVAIRSTYLTDPLLLIATMAHELGHVILLGGGLLSPKPADHEPLTDLLTVYLGLGVFNANAAGRFRQYQDERRYGWSMSRLGYLPEEVYGYALAKFAIDRGEENPTWAKHLSTNVRAYFKKSRLWLARNKYEISTARPIG